MDNNTPFNFLFRIPHHLKRFTPTMFFFLISVIVVTLFNYHCIFQKATPNFNFSFQRIYTLFCSLTLISAFVFPFFSNIWFFFFTPLSHLHSAIFFVICLFYEFLLPVYLLFLLCLYFVFVFSPGFIGFKMGDLDRLILSFITCVWCWGKLDGLMRFHHA